VYSSVNWRSLRHLRQHHLHQTIRPRPTLLATAQSSPSRQSGGIEPRYTDYLQSGQSVLVRVWRRERQGCQWTEKGPFSCLTTGSPNDFVLQCGDPENPHGILGGLSRRRGYSSSADPIAGKAIVLPQRFVSMVLMMSISRWRIRRSSAIRPRGSLAPCRRSRSKQGNLPAQEFTDDHEVLKRRCSGLFRAHWGRGFLDCPDLLLPGRPDCE
jgi:hypothetical protein